MTDCKTEIIKAMKRRVERIAERIRRVTSEIVHGQLNDPRLDGFITITKVEVTPDLRFAKIYYSPFGDEKRKKIIAQGLKSARGFVRKHIGDELKLRYTPDIAFKLDEEMEYSKRINTILGKIKEEKNNEIPENGPKNSEQNQES